MQSNDPPSVSHATSLKSFYRQNRGAVIGSALLFALLAAGGVWVDGFVSYGNLRSMLLLAAFLGLASVGQTFCSLLGGLDLSIPFVIGSANIGMAALMGHGVPPAPAAVLTLLLASLVGLCNGVLTLRIQGQALIVTLGVGFALVGGTQILTSMGSAFAGNVGGGVPDWLVALASISGTTAGLPLPPVAVIWGLVAVAIVVFMRRNRYGRGFYALGGSRTAASRLGIGERRYWIAAYGVSGFMAGLTGVLLLGFSGGGFVGVGDPYLFTTVAAVVIGGTSLLGGWGGHGATVVGTLVLTTLTSLLVGIGFSFAAQQAVVGLLIVPMVALYARTAHLRMQI